MYITVIINGIKYKSLYPIYYPLSFLLSISYSIYLFNEKKNFIFWFRWHFVFVFVFSLKYNFVILLLNSFINISDMNRILSISHKLLIFFCFRIQNYYYYLLNLEKPPIHVFTDSKFKKSRPITWAQICSMFYFTRY